jgi:hypothetical protein
MGLAPVGVLPLHSAKSPDLGGHEAQAFDLLVAPGPEAFTRNLSGASPDSSTSFDSRRTTPFTLAAGRKPRFTRSAAAWNFPLAVSCLAVISTLGSGLVTRI